MTYTDCRRLRWQIEAGWAYGYPLCCVLAFAVAWFVDYAIVLPAVNILWRCTGKSGWVQRMARRWFRRSVRRAGVKHESLYVPCSLHRMAAARAPRRRAVFVGVRPQYCAGCHQTTYVTNKYQTCQACWDRFI